MCTTVIRVLFWPVNPSNLGWARAFYIKRIKHGGCGGITKWFIFCGNWTIFRKIFIVQSLVTWNWVLCFMPMGNIKRRWHCSFTICNYLNLIYRIIDIWLSIIGTYWQLIVLDKNITPDAESEDEVQIIAVGEKSADLLFKKNKTIEVSICRYCLWIYCYHQFCYAYEFLV